jgi:hypothetical protein
VKQHFSVEQICSNAAGICILDSVAVGGQKQRHICLLADGKSLSFGQNLFAKFVGTGWH